jgi:hypothetical protein
MGDIYKEALSEDTSIWVSPLGSDARGNGYFESPFATIEKAVAAITSTKKTVVLMSGSYTMAAGVDITVNGTKFVGIGDVQIDASACATYGFKTVFGTSSGTKEVTFKNINIDAGAKVGIQLQNTGATAKVMCYMTDCEMYNTSASYSAVDVDHAVVAGQAIRLYANRCVFKGKIDIVVGDDGDRFRFTNCEIRGGLVSDAGNYDAEILCAWCIILDGGITGGHSNQRAITVNCVTETNADPNVYGLFASSDIATQADQVIGS